MSGVSGAKVPWFYLCGVLAVLWICRAFDSCQAVRFYRDIVRCFDRIFAGIWSITRCEISIWRKDNKSKSSWRSDLFWLFTWLGMTNKWFLLWRMNVHLEKIAVLWHKAGQEGRGEILLENSFRRWRCYQGKIMHTASNHLSVLYVLKKHRQNINNTTTPPTLLFLASWPSYTRASCHSKIFSIRINLRVSCSRSTSTSQK